MKLLLVEDNPEHATIVRWAIERMVERLRLSEVLPADFQVFVTEVATKFDAVRMLREDDFDVAVWDCNLSNGKLIDFQMVSEQFSDTVKFVGISSLVKAEGILSKERPTEIAEAVMACV